jgi:hypothetical protein
LRTNFPASNASVQAPACSSVGSMLLSNPRVLLCRRFRGWYRFKSVGSKESVATVQSHSKSFDGMGRRGAPPQHAFPNGGGSMLSQHLNSERVESPWTSSQN